jgi:hypothetical protein
VDGGAGESIVSIAPERIGDFPPLSRVYGTARRIGCPLVEHPEGHLPMYGEYRHSVEGGRGGKGGLRIDASSISPQTRNSPQHTRIERITYIGAGPSTFVARTTNTI